MPRAYRAPERARRAVSQAFNDGLVSIYAVTDGAAAGHKPEPQRTLRVTLQFDERRVGVERFYRSAQAQERISRVLRVPLSSITLHAQDQAQVTGDSRWYRVVQIQTVPDVLPACLDLSLSLVDQDATGGDGNA